MKFAVLFAIAFAITSTALEGFGMGGIGQGPFGRSYLAIEVSSTDPKFLPMDQLFEVVIRFWRDFLRDNGPYTPLPEGKTKLQDA